MASHDDMVPERGWSRRVAVIQFIAGVPQDIQKWYRAVWRKHGIDVANLVLYVHSTWGPAVARELAKKILSFDSFEDLIRYLESRLSIFDERSRRVLSNLIYAYKYTYFLNRLLEILDAEHPDDEALQRASLTLFHNLASRGIFYTPECIVDYTKVVLGVKPKVGSKCKRLASVAGEYLGERGERGETVA